MSSQNPSTAFARTVLESLPRNGIRDVVLAPGSRSAPLAMAAARAERAGLIRLHVRVDERSAGYLALGLAVGAGRPVALICTSGTAVANLLPAVVEASYQGVPLVVLTADRPPEARHTGSPQTIDQVGIFGTHVRLFVDVPTPAASAEGDWADLVATAAAAACGDTGAPPGPVHLNCPLRPPLVPDGDSDERGQEDDAVRAQGNAADADTNASQATEIDGAGTHPGGAAPATTGVGTGATDRLVASRPAAAGPDGIPARGLLVVGHIASAPDRTVQHAAAALAAACGWPIITEPSSCSHDAPTALAHGILLLGSPHFRAEHAPELVVTVGLVGLSRPLMDLLRQAPRHVAVRPPRGGIDPPDPLHTAEQVLDRLPDPPQRPDVDPMWLQDWQHADEVAARVVAESVAADVAGRGLTGPAIARSVWSSWPDDGVLLAASSWPVRHLEAYAPTRSGLRVVGNRGANGIDGLLSTAWGVALGHRDAGGGPTVALVGDLAFLHDDHGLRRTPGEPVPDLTVVVVDNNGGGIFSQLEQGGPQFSDTFERVFGTPHDLDLVAVARANGAVATSVTTLTQLVEALSRARATPGVHVLVARVDSRAADQAWLQEVAAAVDAALDAGSHP